MKTIRNKWVAALLVAAMVLTMVPAFAVSAADTEDWTTVNELPEKYTNGNLAAEDGVTVIRTEGDAYAPHNDATWGWDNTGNALRDNTLNLIHVELEGGCDVNGGYHSGTIRGKNHEEYVGYDFGAEKTFDTMVIWPCRDNREWNGTWYPGMPSCFTIDISNDGATWITVTSAYGYEVYEAGPQTFQFNAVSARYVRLNARSVNYAGSWALKLSEIGVYNWGYTPSAVPAPKNLAKTATVTSNSHHEDGPWHLAYVNDGDCYNLNQSQFDFGQFCGYHTTPGGPADAEVTFDLGEKTTVNQMVVWPGTERFRNQDKSNAVYYPQNIDIQVSDDGDTWTTVKEIRGVSVTEWAPITYDFDPVDARFVRFQMVNLEGNAKISEIQIFNTAVIVDPDAVTERNDINLALNKSVIASSLISDNSWSPFQLTNGVVEENGGFTTQAVSSASVGIDFDGKTKFNRIVLYSASISEEDTQDGEAVWSGIPHSFTVEVSDDNVSWRVVTNVTVDQLSKEQVPVTVAFDTEVARYVRINSSDLYSKPSDSGRTYIQLAEMEVYYDVELNAEDNFGAYLQTRENGDTHDMRVVLVANVDRLSAVEAVDVSIEFTLENGAKKTFKGTLGGSNNTYSLYYNVTAAGATYRAADGCALFGNVITGIPNGAYTSMTVTITESGTSNVLFTAGN